MLKTLKRITLLILKFLKKIILNPVIKLYTLFIGNIKWYYLQKNKVIKLELGSGAKYGSNGWVTVDLSGSDINWDLRRGIPLKNESVDIIYSSHLLEHIPYKNLIPFLNECSRVLKKDGEFSVCVPNIKNYINAYNSGEEFLNRENYWQKGYVDTNSKLDQINYMAYMDGEHQYMFDEENLINTILKANFSSAKLRKYNKNIDLLGRDFESIYAVAYKK